MRRIAVMGSPGSGKTRFAVRLGDMTGVPVVHLDRLNWRPGWREAPMEVYRSAHDAAVARDRWIIDGDYSRHFGERLRRADTIVLFALPTRLTLFRIAKRVLLLRGEVRPDMPEGCPERWDWAFMHWVWRWRRHRLPAIRAAIGAQGADARLVEVHSKGDGETALAWLAKAVAGDGVRS